MKREPYHIIIMRPTGEKPVMTIHALWVRVIFILIVALIGLMIVLSLKLTHARYTNNEQEQVIKMQSEEMKDLNILLTRKDEEIISLKKKLSMSISHKASTITEEKSMPKLYPPIAEITGVTLDKSNLTFKLENVVTESRDTAKGYIFAVFKKGDEVVCHPSVKLVDGIPMDKKKGIPFMIRRYKPMSIKIPRSILGWQTVKFYIFDDEEKLRLIMPFNKAQVQ